MARNMADILCVRIDRCVCKQRSFEELKSLAVSLDLDLDMLALATGATTDCGRCRPWVARMLETGETCFIASLPDDGPGRDLAAHFGLSDPET